MDARKLYISHVVAGVGIVGALATEHHLPELLRRLQGKRSGDKIELLLQDRMRRRRRRAALTGRMEKDRLGDRKRRERAGVTWLGRRAGSGPAPSG